MKTKISTPLAFSEIGRKDNQEDRVCPEIDALTDQQRCLVLCDGMGGHERGEVAAEIVSKNLWANLDKLVRENGDIDERLFNVALSKTFDALDEMTFETEKRPGTTMTSIVFNDNGTVTAAHIGDSRIYQVRPGEGIVYRSFDHSLVNELIKAGELTEEQAVNFPRKNVITRALQPKLDRRPSADIRVLDNIKSGDYFFLCSDGILEQLTDARLVEILSSSDNNDDKLTAIFNQCFNKTRDNFTCLLVQVEKADPSIKARRVVAKAGVTASNSDNQGKRPDNNLNSSLKLILMILVAAIVLLLLYYFLFARGGDDAENADEVQKDTIQQQATPPAEPAPGVELNDSSRHEGKPDGKPEGMPEGREPGNVLESALREGTTAVVGAINPSSNNKDKEIQKEQQQNSDKQKESDKKKETAQATQEQKADANKQTTTAAQSNSNSHSTVVRQRKNQK